MPAMIKKGIMNLQNKSRISLYIVILTYIIGVFTVSFDDFLVLSNGFNFKFAYFAFSIPILFSLTNILLKGKAYKPLGLYSLLLWTLFIFIFVFIFEIDFIRNLGYAMWLLFSVLLIFATVQIFSSYNRIIYLFKGYIYSFCFVAVFGLIQFILALFHVNAPLHVPSAWWIADVLPRINAFSYEPSFFATYLMSGWVLLAYLLEKGQAIISIRQQKIFFVIFTITIILSGARMAWFMMTLYSAKFPILFIKRVIKGRINYYYFRFSLLLVIIMTSFLLFMIIISGMDYFSVMFSGKDASPYIRMRNFEDTVTIFKNSPYIGYSLGGVSSAIAALHGANLDPKDPALSFSGICVFMEVLAASGIFGFIPFLFYIGTIVIKPLRLAKTCPDKYLSMLLTGMVISLVFLLGILQFNQNILRPYVWLHIGILTSLYSVVIRSKKNKNLSIC